VSVSIGKTTGHRQYSNPLAPTSLTNSDDLVLAGWLPRMGFANVLVEQHEERTDKRQKGVCQGFVCKRKMSLHSY
jgi:hypothetical protein